MAQVVLVYPAGGFAPKSPPLGVLHLAAMLRQADVSVAVLDASVEPAWRDRLAEVIDAGTLCAGVSAMTGPQIAGGLEVARVVRALRPELPVVWGGVHPQLVPEQTLADPRVDVVCTGDVEQWFQSTRYFNDFVTALSQARNDQGTPVARARRQALELAFPLVAAPVRARGRLRWPHAGPDTRLWRAAGRLRRRTPPPPAVASN